jgi:hypothetical protein
MVSPFFPDVEHSQCKNVISAYLAPFSWLAFLDALFLCDYFFFF